MQLRAWGGPRASRVSCGRGRRMQGGAQPSELLIGFLPGGGKLLRSGCECPADLGSAWPIGSRELHLCLPLLHLQQLILMRGKGVSRFTRGLIFGGKILKLYLFIFKAERQPELLFSSSLTRCPPWLDGRIPFRCPIRAAMTQPHVSHHHCLEAGVRIGARQ